MCFAFILLHVKNNVHLAKSFIRKQNYINNKKLFVLHRGIRIIIQCITDRSAYTNTDIQAPWEGWRWEPPCCHCRSSTCPPCPGCGKRSGRSDSRFPCAKWRQSVSSCKLIVITSMRIKYEKLYFHLQWKIPQGQKSIVKTLNILIPPETTATAAQTINLTIIWSSLCSVKIRKWNQKNAELSRILHVSWPWNMVF